jgi:hypothetical protein
MRIWQAWHSVISHNLLSGASLDGVKGDHAMKLHGPGIGPDNCLGPAVPNTYMLEKRTDYVVVSDNAFGSSGPWPVMICPTNQGQDENLSNIVFERNRLSAQFGTQLTPVQVSLKVAANRVSIRNNVIDATGAHTEWVGIDLTRHGVEPKPTRIAVYNNTIYRADDPEGGFRFGIRVHEEASDVVIANNLVSCASSFLPVEAVHDSSGMAQRSATVVIKDPKFADPTNADPLQRDFSLLPAHPPWARACSSPSGKISPGGTAAGRLGPGSDGEPLAAAPPHFTATERRWKDPLRTSSLITTSPAGRSTPIVPLSDSPSPRGRCTSPTRAPFTQTAT